MVGQIIGGYEIQRPLGQGGMGAVFEAVHQQIGQRAAVKVLHPHISADPDFARRFFNEARVVAMLAHPGVVKIFDYGQRADGTFYLLMEYLEGDSLRARLARRGGLLSLAEALRLSRQLASTLATAHERGVVHRDLKPDNVIIVSDAEAPGGERAKLLDFGIAKVLDQPSDGGVRTATGAIMGTPLYMAPEQCRGASQVDGQVDVYALGVILYEALSGRPPFCGGQMQELLIKHLLHAPAA